jgi:ATP synthase in type III secretion protein N
VTTLDDTSVSMRLARLVPRLKEAVDLGGASQPRGRVRSITGTILRAAIPAARIGELCYLRDPVSGKSVPAEVVGFQGDEAILTPIGDMEGLSNLTEVTCTGAAIEIPVGSAMLGRVVDPLGNFLDGPSPSLFERYPLHRDAPSPLQRAVIATPVRLGVRALDGLLTAGLGQRIGIFGEAGSGKSSLLSSIVRGSAADVLVIGLIGERGREVREFVENQLDAASRARSVLVVSTSDRPAMERVKAAYVATSIAEYFRDQGLNVLLVLDSITRFARAQREIGLSAGEPPTRRGFPPSFFAALPRLLERAGRSDRGSITALYTVLTEGDASQDPVAEEVRSILDGHVVLSPELAARNHFPAIDILASRSRLMTNVVGAEHRSLAAEIRSLLSRYADLELLIRVGEYRPGSDPEDDRAVQKHGQIMEFLRQPLEHQSSVDEAISMMRKVVA